MLTLTPALAAPARFIVKGINQDRNFCECCGKQGISRVVWIEDTVTGSIKHFGSSCAMNPRKGFDCIPALKKAVRDLDCLIKQFMARQMRQYREAGGTYANPNAYDFTPTNPELWASIGQQLTAQAYQVFGHA